jgi:hypothetical protein
LINITDLRKNSSIKSKAESMVKKILDLDSDDLSSDTNTVDSSYNSVLYAIFFNSLVLPTLSASQSFAEDKIYNSLGNE